MTDKQFPLVEEAVFQKYVTITTVTSPEEYTISFSTKLNNYGDGLQELVAALHAAGQDVAHSLIVSLGLNELYQRTKDAPEDREDQE